MTDNTYGINDRGGHVWLGIDPGITTGWAIVSDQDRSVLGCGNAQPDQVEEVLDTVIRAMHQQERVVHVVMEKLPKVGGNSPHAARLDVVSRAIYGVVIDCFDLPVTTVQPGTWKTSRVARTTDPRELWKDRMTQHQKDAVLMALWGIDNRGR